MTFMGNDKTETFAVCLKLLYNLPLFYIITKKENSKKVRKQFCNKASADLDTILELL